MFEKKFSSMMDGITIDSPEQDYKTAKRVGQYKISETAIYKPDRTYLPIKEICETIHDQTSVHVSGCCAGGVIVERLIFVTKAAKYPFLFDSLKEVDRVLEVIEKNNKE